MFKHINLKLDAAHLFFLYVMFNVCQLYIGYMNGALFSKDFVFCKGLLVDGEPTGDTPNFITICKEKFLVIISASNGVLNVVYKKMECQTTRFLLNKNNYFFCLSAHSFSN